MCLLGPLFDSNPACSISDFNGRYHMDVGIMDKRKDVKENRTAWGSTVAGK